MKPQSATQSAGKNGIHPKDSQILSSPSFQKKKSTLTSDSKNLLQRLNVLKHQMQKNVTQQNGTVDNERTSFSATKAEKVKLSLPSKEEHVSLDKIDRIRQNIIGFNTRYISPFNIELQAVYVDHTATNRPYQSVETMIRYAKKFAANPHTEFSHFGKYSTDMMHYAHDSLLRSFSADPEHYVALPTGSGSTGAIEKAMKIIQDFDLGRKVKPIVYLTPYEHHSNILPWVEFYDQIEVLTCDQNGILVMNKIQEQLKKSPANKLIVSISAASNVTSTITELKELNQIIRSVRKQKEVIFAADCAAFCCHHELNLKIYDQLDFAYLSPHKNLGGAESCGVLIARKDIIKNAKPTFPGGGTVKFVMGYTKTDVMYDVDVFNRQIAGTPPFMGFYRAALSFQLLKNDIGYNFIHEREVQNTQLFVKLMKQGNEALKKDNGTQIIIYGDLNLQTRANVVTFNVLMKGQQIMQHDLVSLILADVFGIQLRSGCFCAGPFGMRLLKIDLNSIGPIREEVSVGIFRDKPGYLRLDLTFYLELYEIQFIAKALLGLAKYHSNLNMVYTLCNDGQIRRHKLFLNFIHDKFSLCNSNIAKEQVQFDQTTTIERLKRRRQILDKQYKRGMDILMKPIEFLRSQINK